MAQANIIDLRTKLDRLPENKVGEVNDFIDFLLQKSKVKEPENISLKGIWKGKGFESIHNLDSQIRDLRKETSDATLRRA
ncbi:MAG: hypothetical protein A2096_10100 [Spirochaetes bacterium GWF1_41_5]|nr:MAG: hypothetical protein A2096_10100 [Spirochaetes bacterium GWF1_41_5]HBE02525.1 hypothetical protein [Spirochaetia bacterium]